jgi:crotonobetainyl-CoA:carnitine CoA-transferase CaiB-like acyl-CoA transferase
MRAKKLTPMTRYQKLSLLLIPHQPPIIVVREDQWNRLLRAMGCEDLMGDPRFATRVCLPSSPLRFTDAPAPALKPSPFLNQHVEEVLGGIFGFSPEERTALREAGAISAAAQVKG